MLFAAFDYLQYRRRKGRFGNHQPSGMGLSFLGRMSDEVIADLEIGDCIVTQRLDSLFSWAMLYFSSSAIDHVAIYIGNGRISHMTLSGYKEHSIHVFGRNTRLLPLRLGPPRGVDPFDFDDGYTEMEKKQRWMSRFSPKMQLAVVGAQIVAGIYPDRFRWKFLVDLILVGIALDLFAFWIINVPIFTILGTTIASLCALTFGINRLRKASGVMLERLNHPDLTMRAFGRIGGVMFTSLGPLVACDFGLLPVKAFRALGRQSAENGPDDKLEPLRQYVRDALESWNLTVSVENSEDEDSDQNDREKD